MSLKERLKQEKTKEENNKFEIKDEIFEFNSLGVLDLLLVDNEINSIFVAGAKNVYVRKANKTYKSTTVFRDNAQLEGLIKKTGNDLGIKLGANNPFIKFNHKPGINVSMTLPPLSDTGTIFVKCYRDNFASFDSFVQKQIISKEMAFVFETLSYLGGNIIIAGEKNALKTSFLSALSKKIPKHERGILIDYSQEIKQNSANFANFDFSQLKSREEKKTLLDSIFAQKPSKVFVNDAIDDLPLYLSCILSGFKGLVLTLEASSKEEIIEKLTYSILETKPYLNYELAKSLCLKAFNLIINTTTDEEGKRKVTSLTQIENGQMEDIFNLNDFNEHTSCGVKPCFYNEIKEFIGSNIFEVGYKHTYPNFEEEKETQPVKKNVDILKKFKKKTEENNDDIQETQDLYQEVMDDDSLDIENLDIDTLDSKTLDEVLSDEKIDE